MRVERVVPVLQVPDIAIAAELHRAVLGWSVLMDHGWIVTLGDSDGHQLSLLTHDASAPTNPDVSVFVDDVHEAHRRAVAAGAEIVHPHGGAVGSDAVLLPGRGGRVINVGTHT
jgi:predicted enzyme related to lactoylglutathione lyase